MGVSGRPGKEAGRDRGRTAAGGALGEMGPEGIGALGAERERSWSRVALRREDALGGGGAWEAGGSYWGSGLAGDRRGERAWLGP